nr:putative ribonuclease H-like domain-containing protein [Tanacetum cinerariifolium]
ARYSAFKISEVITEEPKAMVSVDSMLNWNEHEAKHKTEEAEQVYGLMVGFESDFAVHAADRIPCKNNFARTKKCFVCGNKSHLIKDCHVYDTVDNFLSIVSQAASVPVGSRNSLASTSAGRSIPAASKHRSASIHAGRSISAASRHRSASIHAGGSIPAASRHRSASIYANGSIPAASKHRSASIYAGRSIPTASRNRSASIHADRSIPAASRNRPASIHAGKHIPAGRINEPAPFPAGSSVTTGWTNPAARLFCGPTNLYFDNVYWPGIYDHMSMNERRWGSAVKSSAKKLDDFVQVKGCTVTFGGGDGKIIGKGTIRTSKLNFEIVYYVEELQNFNLFSVSQICDKKNKVLFTDDECLVLTKEFQLPDESQVVLRIPRRHDLYTFNLSDIQPEQHINFLLAKASLEESTKWYRRMTHVNFKTINKLAKHGLVEGIPLKLFTNEHNCVACNIAKQHKASYKAIFAVRTIFEPLQLLHMDLFGLTSMRSIDHKYYSLVVTDDFSRFCWAFFLGAKDETFYILKDFLALIENQLNKKIKAIRCDNGTEFQNKKLIALCGEKGIKRDYSNARTPQQNGVEETLNLRYLEDKPNVQGLGQEWYFDLDYLTDSSDPTVHDVSAPIENNLDYAEELARLQKQEYEAHSAVAKHGFEFSNDTAAMLHQAAIETRRNLVLAAGDPAGSIFPASGVPAGSLPASHVLASSVPPGSLPASSVPAGSVPAGSVPASHVPASSIPAEPSSVANALEDPDWVAAMQEEMQQFYHQQPDWWIKVIGKRRALIMMSVPASHVPASSIPAGGVLTGNIDSAEFGDPAGSESVLAVFANDPVATSPLPPGHSLGSCEHSTRFSSSSDLENHQPTADIFSSSSYDDDFCADVTNLASNVDVDPVATKRVNTIHPQSQIIGELLSLVQTRSTVQKSKCSESAFISYVHNQ